MHRRDATLKKPEQKIQKVNSRLLNAVIRQNCKILNFNRPIGSLDPIHRFIASLFGKLKTDFDLWSSVNLSC